MNPKKSSIDSDNESKWIYWQATSVAVRKMLKRRKLINQKKKKKKKKERL